jgi:transposase
MAAHAATGLVPVSGHRTSVENAPGRVSLGRRKRRAFAAEQKAEAVRLVQRGSRSIGQVALDLDLTESALRRWVEQVEVDAGRRGAGALTSAEREALTQPRRETRRLTQERDF